MRQELIAIVMAIVPALSGFSRRLAAQTSMVAKPELAMVRQALDLRHQLTGTLPILHVCRSPLEGIVTVAFDSTARHEHLIERTDFGCRISAGDRVGGRPAIVLAMGAITIDGDSAVLAATGGIARCTIQRETSRFARGPAEGWRLVSMTFEPPRSVADCLGRTSRSNH